MDILERFYFGKLIYAMIVIPCKVIFAFVKTFRYELLALFVIFLTCFVGGFYDVPVLWTMEKNLLSKMGLNISFSLAESPHMSDMLVFLLVCFVLSLGRKISRWTRAAYYGVLASFGASFLVLYLRVDWPEIYIPSALILVIMLAITVLFMRMGFHRDENYISEDSEILGVVVGIVPALLLSFISVCTIMTSAFDKAVEDKFSYVIWAIVLELVIYGAGIFLYFFFGRDDVETMLRKEGYQVETRVVEIAENESKEPTVKASNDVAPDFTLNDNILEQIRNKNNK